MSHFGRTGPPDIRDTFSLLVLNISFRERALTLAPSSAGARPLSLTASFASSSSSNPYFGSQAPRRTTSSRSSSATARLSTSSSRGTGGEGHA